MEFIAPMFTSICKTIRYTFHHTQSHTFISGFATYLAMDHDIHFPPGPYWYCALTNGILFSAFLCSTLLILSMTFDRFYSIIRPHKAATFNTVKRAKITIFAVVVFSILYNIISVPMTIGSVFLMAKQWRNHTDRFTIGCPL